MKCYEAITVLLLTLNSLIPASHADVTIPCDSSTTIQVLFQKRVRNGAVIRSLWTVEEDASDDTFSLSKICSDEQDPNFECFYNTEFCDSTEDIWILREDGCVDYTPYVDGEEDFCNGRDLYGRCAYEFDVNNVTSGIGIRETFLLETNGGVLSEVTEHFVRIQANMSDIEAAGFWALDMTPTVASEIFDSAFSTLESRSGDSCNLNSSAQITRLPLFLVTFASLFTAMFSFSS